MGFPDRQLDAGCGRCALHGDHDRQAVISIEKYKYTPSLELAFKIAEVFGVSIDEVFEHREDK